MEIKEFHLFAGIGGGIYGGQLLGHKCCGGMEIDTYCQKVIKQRQEDGWFEKFPIYNDITKLNGADFKGAFNILCGGFPCQAFSHAAHGKNILEKNLWGEMLKFIIRSDAPIVFCENVVLKAITQAKQDLEHNGYRVGICRLSCRDLGADHRRDRFWCLGVKDEKCFNEVYETLSARPLFTNKNWSINPHQIKVNEIDHKKAQLKCVGNAQSPLAAAMAFRILSNRLHNKDYDEYDVVTSKVEIENIFKNELSWIKRNYGEDEYVHTPTTMANYCCKYMM